MEGNIMVRRCKKCGVYETSEYLSPNGFCVDHESERVWKNGKRIMQQQNAKTIRMHKFVQKRNQLERELDEIEHKKGTGKIFRVR
jgi:hypothetical protein